MLLLAALLVTTQTDTIRINQRLCAQCEIRVERVATLGEPTGSGMVTTPRVRVARDARGRYLVTTARSQLSVFSPTGSYLRSVGRGGGGPGEYRRIWQIGTSRSGVFLFDDVGRRRTQLTLDFDVVSTTQMAEAPFSVLMRPDGSSVMSATVPTRELTGFLLHDFSARGERKSSRQLSGLPYREDVIEFFQRHLSPSADPGRFWASQLREYAFSQCKFDSDRCSLFFRAVDWFPRPSLAPWTDEMGSKPPPPYLYGVSEDSAGFLWTISWVPDARWRSAIELVSRDEYTIVDFDRYWDAVVERIDLRSRSVIASRRFDHLFLGFVAPGIAWRYRENADGFGRLEIERLVLEDKRATPEER